MIELSDRFVGILIILTVPAALLFPIVYAFTTRWWETLVGKSLLVKSTATLLLMALAMLVRVFEIDPHVAAVLRLIVMALICLGVNMMFVALMKEKWPALKRRAADCGRNGDTPLT
jgi:hypothetical protein